MLITESESELIFELIYDANKSMMSSRDLGEAILGMSTCISVVGRSAKLDFESVHIFPIEHGSIRTLYTFVKRNKDEIIVQTISASLGGVIIAGFLGAVALIGQHGLPALKTPCGEILKSANAAVIELCTNAEFRRSITKIARPVNELNQKVIIKVNENSYEINCENQYKFLTEDEEEILPELQNGETVSLIGMLTRMNMRNNDLGFEYHGKTLSISPVDPDKNVATEYHQFTPLPQVQVMGIVARDNAFVVPRLKVIKMSVPENIQPELFKDNKKELASNSAQNIK